MRAARMLVVPTPRLPRVQRILGTYARAALEADLAEAGLDVAA
jgi:hypothetical protein